MNRLRIMLTAAVLGVAVRPGLLLAETKPTRRDAVAVLKDLRAAIAAKDPQAALKRLQRLPEWDDKRYEEVGRHIVTNAVFPRKATDALSKNGLWGPAGKVFDKERLRRRAAYYGIKPTDCYGLVLKDASVEMLFRWDGARLRVFHYQDSDDMTGFDKFIAELVQTMRGRERDSRGLKYVRSVAARQAEALDHLAEMGPMAETVIPDIAKLLASDNAGLRLRAAVALWRIDYKSAPVLKPLIEGFSDSEMSDGLRISAVDCLGGMGRQAVAATDALRAVLNAPKPTLRVAVAKALWEITGDSVTVLPILLGSLKGDDPQASITAGKALSRMGLDSESLTALRRGPGPKRLVVGFSQIGAESWWRMANTRSIKNEAKKRGIDLRFLDAQYKQEDQVKALRSFIKQKVDVIAFSPFLSTGWVEVLREIKTAGIPVILTDREVRTNDKSLYMTVLGPDFVEEGRCAARWLAKNTKGELRILELTGTPGSLPAFARRKGFVEVVAENKRMKIIRSQTGNFMHPKGREVTEAFLKAFGAKACNVIYAHNDHMALGAIQAIKAAGLKPGKDIKIVSIDGVKDALEALVAGELNCSVECSPEYGPQLFDIIEAVGATRGLLGDQAKRKLLKPEALKALKGELFEKRVSIETRVFDQTITKEFVEKRAY